VSNTQCPLPWVSLEVSATGGIKPCCLVEVPVAQVHASSFVEAAQTAKMAAIRNAMLAGQRPAECVKCWEAEDAGHTSKRQHAIKKYGLPTEQQFRFLDLKLGNICNIKCRICGDTSSSQWATETYQHTRDRKRYAIIAEAGRWPRETPQFWSEIEAHLMTVEELEITGGEPLLIQEQFAVLKRAIELGVAKNISIHYNTNGTIYPADALQDIWPHFKKVELAFSIDDVGNRFTYERFPAQWDTVQENFKKVNWLRLSERWLQTQICCTVSKFNVYYLPEIAEFISSARPTTWYYNLLHSETIYNISHFSPAVKQVIKRRLEEKMSHLPFYTERVAPIINFMMVDNSPNDAEFLARVAEVDRWRDQSLAVTHPELYRLLNAEA
jgi:MoaA/NifB/PqqE/SkfB family radical SAM enzyme